jgi:Tfp pilus assembly protein PilN
MHRRIPIGKAETMTGFVPMMWALWFVLILVFVALSVYISHLAKNEEDQLYLYESSSHVKAEQDAMLARVQRIEPFKRIALALAALMTLFVIGYYVLNMVNQFR